MTAQGLFFNDFSQKDPHLNAAEYIIDIIIFPFHKEGLLHKNK